MSIVDGEFCVFDPALLARARQAKVRAQNVAKRSGGQAARPPVAARFRVLEGPVLKAYRKLSGGATPQRRQCNRRTYGWRRTPGRKRYVQGLACPSHDGVFLMVSRSGC